ncbi:Ig-like domain-containing protein, partial [Salmonella enterica subsp. enterica serovar Kentucky]|nr:Ig-like domain-containing protein [Salmonella enterica subsp. enterica serovar Kentucky]
VRRSEPVFQQGERFYTLVKSAKRPVAAIVSTSKQRFYQNLFHTWSYTLTTPLKDGEYNITATATDIAGHTSATANLPFTIDTRI